MSLMKRWSIATLTAALVRQYAKSLPSVESLECSHCGLAIRLQRVDGTLSSTFVIDLNQRKPSRSKLVLGVTVAGNVSISCEHSRSDEHLSHHGSGVVDGTFSSPENSARSCGCDPGAAHFCDEYPECAYGQELRKGSVRDA